MNDCTIVRDAGRFHGRQALDYETGISARTAPAAQALALHKLVMPPGARATAHRHEGHESAIHMLEGSCEFWWGSALEHHDRLDAGEFLHIPAGVPHLPYNASSRTATAIVARADADEQESVVLLPELDRLPHLPPRAGGS